MKILEKCLEFCFQITVPIHSNTHSALILCIEEHLMIMKYFPKEAFSIRLQLKHAVREIEMEEL